MLRLDGADLDQGLFNELHVVLCDRALYAREQPVHLIKEQNRRRILLRSGKKSRSTV